ncbi:MAG: sulfurtransferase [Fimbriimonadaceae bacterium]|jgi:thiosulfate/3-mercaptopyruvate sulfurtransferase|nr:sulfurtransferase [Fimbriimonadaceae bacterium]
MSTFTSRGYATETRLVDTEWVAEHLNDPNVRLIESNEDLLLYTTGHIPNAFEIDWTGDLNDPIMRDYLGKKGFEALMSRLGCTPETLIVFYGDKNNWWACYALWVFELFGHLNTAIMDGGRIKWTREGRPLTTDIPEANPTEYLAPDRDDKTNRAFRDDVLRHVVQRGKMIDVRSNAEFTGERLHMEGYPNEGAVRGGHIPGAANVPWARAINPEDGTFKTASELRELYEGEAGLEPEADIITYCRIGERSSHTWYVLKYLLGYNHVRNYDGSWTEWGNSVGVPIEK